MKVEFDWGGTVVPLPPRCGARVAAPSPTSVTASVVPLWGICPWSDELSDYDRRNIDLYARLLHDESEGAGEDDLLHGIFCLDPHRDRGRALAILRSHMARAHWIADALFQMLGW